MSKGFYFSFDALLALTVMAATLALVSQSSTVASDSFQISSIDYRKSTTVGQDAMKLASQEKFNTFNDSFSQEIADQTVIEEKDFEKSIIDGVTRLWAARNFTHAEKVTENYFDSKIPDSYEYRLQVNEGGERTVIYKSSDMPENPEIVSSISRLVSGHKIDRPSEGFQARARATDITANQTSTFVISSQGGAVAGETLSVQKQFNLSAEEIHEATFYVAPHYGCSDSDFIEVEVNDMEYNYNDVQWIDVLDNCGWFGSGRGALGEIDVSEAVVRGKNNLSVRFRNPEYNAHTQPGFRLETTYRESITRTEEDLQHERIYFENATTTAESENSGLFSIKGYELPDGAELVNATLHVNASGLERQCNDSEQWWDFCYERYDVRVLHGDEVLNRGYAPSSGEYGETFDITDETVEGTNTVSLYFNWEGDTGWSNQDINLYSDFKTEESTHIDLWYRREDSGLEFGQVRVSDSKQFGETGNPIQVEKEFEYSDIKSSYVFPAQLTGYRIEVDAWSQTSSRTEVFQSPASRAIPASIYIEPSNFNPSNNVENYVELNDLNDNIFHESSSFQYSSSVPSQVGYGGLFPNLTAAREDARQRLNTTLGSLVDAESITTDTVSTGDQPYLWGPAAVKLVIWRE